MWTLWLLATHPEKQDKLLQEINEVFGDKETLEYEDHEKLKYTLCVIRESMRLHPPIASVLKEAEKDDVIGGHKIPAGTTVTVQFYTVHRDPTLWETPEEFIPERFDEQNAHKIHPMSYMPFSLGSRKCIGFLFSITESVFILAHIIRNFKVGRTEEQKKNGFVPVPRQVITIHPKELTLQFTRRTK
jgi:cytochrome P450